MKVWGVQKITFLSLEPPLASPSPPVRGEVMSISALYLLSYLSSQSFSRSRNLSSIVAPILWRVFLYCCQGFPNQMMSFIR